MDYLDYIDTQDKDIKIRFNSELDKIINEIKYHIKQHRKEIRELKKNDEYNIKLYALDCELKIMIDDRDKFKFIKWNYDFIKYSFYKYEK